MATGESSRESILKSILDTLSSRFRRSFVLKDEQRKAINGLLDGSDILAVLPTGYGKSLIFQLLVLVSKAERGMPTSVLVICPLKAIIDDQVEEAKALGIEACSISDVTAEELKSGVFQLIFGSAELVLNNVDNVISDNLVAIVIDESHTVETWTGKRSQDKSKLPFREAFSRLSMLRSFCKKGTPVLALTGTADRQTQKTIISELALNKPLSLFLSPNRQNLRISVMKCKREQIYDNISWLINVLKDKRAETPKTIMFCNGTLNDIAALFNFILLKLGKEAYVPQDNQSSENCIIGIYHSFTLPKYKERLVKSFKSDGKKRLAIASAALSMGVNFPDVRYIIHWGPPCNMLDYHQESGRAGRDNMPADVIIVYYGQQLGLCEQDVKDFVKTTDCYRIAAYKPFDSNIESLKPGHGCCKNCAKVCKCQGSGECSIVPPVFEVDPLVEASPAQPTMSRPVSPSDKEDLQSALHEMVSNSLLPMLNLLNVNASLDYGNQMVSNLVEKAHTIFTVKDITEHLPVFSIQHALKILEVFHEIFEDIQNIDAMVEVFGRGELEATQLSSPQEHYNFESDSDYSVDVEDDLL